MEYYKIGYIANTLGIKGEMKVLLLSNIPDRFKDLEECYINTGTGRQRVEVERYRPYKTGSIVLKLKGYDDANSVLPFKGKYLEVDRDNLARLEEGQFYVFDIIGCKVLEADGSMLGEVVEVLSPGAHDVYVVKGDKGEILIPAVKEMVKEINIREKIISVQLPEGLVE
jgi:16S rRNA processing protein RimM